MRAELFPDISIGDAPVVSRAKGIMKLTPLQKRAERKARNQTALDMNLVSLIDIFTILIFFLLSSAAGVEMLSSPKAVKLPESTADKQPKRDHRRRRQRRPTSWSTAARSRRSPR